MSCVKDGDESFCGRVGTVSYVELVKERGDRWVVVFAFLGFVFTLFWKGVRRP